MPAHVGPRTRLREHRVVVAQRRRLEALGVLGPLPPLDNGVSEGRLPVGLHVDERPLGLVDQGVHRPLRRAAIQVAVRRSAAARPPAAGSVGLHPCAADPPVVLAAGRIAPLRDRVDDLGRATLALPEEDGPGWLRPAHNAQSKPALPRRYQRRYHSGPISTLKISLRYRLFPDFIGCQQADQQLPCRRSRVRVPSAAFKEAPRGYACKSAHAAGDVFAAADSRPGAVVDFRLR